MSLISRMRRQVAVYWAKSDTLDEYGKSTYAAPVEISCRWEDKISEVFTPKGEKAVAKSTVYVDRIMIPGAVLCLSSLADISNPSDPKSNDGAWEVIAFNRLPNLKNTEELLTAFL